MLTDMLNTDRALNCPGDRFDEEEVDADGVLERASKATGAATYASHGTASGSSAECDPCATSDTLAGASGDSDSESEAVSADAGCVVSYTASGSYY